MENQPKSETDDQILNVVKAEPGLKAKDIAAQLGVDRNTVNSSLYGRLKGVVRQDANYRWYLVDDTKSNSKDRGPKKLNTTLAKLCRYYLDCLSHDDLGGVSEFASSSYGSLSYVELKKLPLNGSDTAEAFAPEEAQNLLGRIRRDRNRQTLLLGYPVRLNHIRSRKGWEGFMVEPILLFSFRESESGHGIPSLSDEPPQMNFRALRALTDLGESNLMEEVIQLTQELGLANTEGEQPDLIDLLSRLREIRSEWDWQEEINPNNLAKSSPLSGINQSGIFNHAVLIAAERSPYTKGLEYELGMLESIAELKYQDTCLGTWLAGKEIQSPAPPQQPLLEVLPLNSEQRQAVRQALSNPVTVITGPPGTGKSQVVASILVNCAWQGKTVLFASKNNKAVDVVETRVNALGPRPVLLRLGANQYQTRLAEYLLSLLAANATKDDEAQYSELAEINGRLRKRFDELDSAVNAIIKVRNEVDGLDRKTESIRADFGETTFAGLRNIDGARLREESATLTAAINYADKTKQSFATRLIWPFIRQGRLSRLADAGSDFNAHSELIRLACPKVTPTDDTISQWVEYSNNLADRIFQVLLAKQYFEKLELLTSSTSLEELALEVKRLTTELEANSEALWKIWLRLQPSRLSPHQRKLLGDYSALLQLIVTAKEENQQLGRDVFRRYYQLFPQITSILPCWAVTSLSVRGRTPFDPNFFDLLVIDEASQCDIASAIPLLFRARRVVVIGDPMQLRHISTLSKQQDQQLLSKHGLVGNHAGWAYSTRSLFDLASSLCKSEDIVVLRDHHRSHANIIEFSNKFFYEGRLRVATKYDRLRRPSKDEAVVRWLDVRGKATRPGAGGAVNLPEAQAVVEEIARLIAQDYKGNIGVVSPFRAQANRIRDILQMRGDLAARIGDRDLLVDTVHKFQGDERDLMIFSPVVSSGISDGALGFLRSNSNLFNVAITRARAALIVVGDKSAALSSNVDYLARFASYVDTIAKQRQDVVEFPISDLGPDYPPVSNPEQVSEWERVFYRALHRSGIRAMPQYVVEKYILDFAVVQGNRRLDIEIDGERYHRNWDGELCRRDQIRNQRLMELGWDVMRFWVYQIRDDLEQCLSRVHVWMEGRAK